MDADDVPVGISHDRQSQFENGLEGPPRVDVMLNEARGATYIYTMTSSPVLLLKR